MIPRQQIIRTADRDGVSAPTVERDYVLSHVVASLAEDPGAEDLMFKGGTALRMCYFDDFRYSADLDLSVSGSAEGAFEAMSRALDACRQAIGFPELALADEATPRIVYLGPLSRSRHIKLDLDVGELTFPSQRARLIQRYDDVADTPGLVTYGLDQITAEKLRCVIQRLQCRDIYDCMRSFTMLVSMWRPHGRCSRRRLAIAFWIPRRSSIGWKLGRPHIARGGRRSYRSTSGPTFPTSKTCFASSDDIYVPCVDPRSTTHRGLHRYASESVTG